MLHLHAHMLVCMCRPLWVCGLSTCSLVTSQPLFTALCIIKHVSEAPCATPDAILTLNTHVLPCRFVASALASFYMQGSVRESQAGSSFWATDGGSNCLCPLCKVCLCLYLCIFVHAYVCACACLYECEYVCFVLLACVCVCTCVYLSVCVEPGGGGI